MNAAESRTRLNWPPERANADNNPDAVWFNTRSNYCLDFHGDPATAELTVYSDGNHHMALEQSLETFREQQGLSGIFYCTTPPKVYLDIMREGYVDLGNLRLSNQPDLVIGPDDIIGKLAENGRASTNRSFMNSRGNSLLVRKGNPTAVSDVSDLFTPECKLFISNPVTEGASFMVYRQSLENLARASGIPEEDIANRFDGDNPTLVYGENIHHREAPAAVASGAADVAMVYHHLALRYTRIFPEIFDLVEVPFSEDNVTTIYNTGICNTDNPDARSLDAFLHSEACRDIYASHGLLQ